MIDLINLKFENYLKKDKQIKANFAAKFNKMIGAKRGKK